MYRTTLLLTAAITPVGSLDLDDPPPYRDDQAPYIAIVAPSTGSALRRQVPAIGAPPDAEIGSSAR